MKIYHRKYFIGAMVEFACSLLSTYCAIWLYANLGKTFGSGTTSITVSPLMVGMAIVTAFIFYFLALLDYGTSMLSPEELAAVKQKKAENDAVRKGLSIVKRSLWSTEVCPKGHGAMYSDMVWFDVAEGARASEGRAICPICGFYKVTQPNPLVGPTK